MDCMQDLDFNASPTSKPVLNYYIIFITVLEEIMQWKLKHTRMK